MNDTLSFTTLGTGERLELRPDRLIVAGYTGRDEAAVSAHINELAEQGIAPPPSVPMFYEMDSRLASSESAVAVSGRNTSGEVEPVYLRIDARWYLAVGSDHTDRDLERDDILQAKAGCVKPVGATLLPLPDNLLGGGFDASFDDISVRSWVDEAPYQSGTLRSLRTPSDVLTRLFAALGDDEKSNLVVFGGTVPLLSGAFVFGTAWQISLQLSDGTSLEHAYSVSTPTG